MAGGSCSNDMPTHSSIPNRRSHQRRCRTFWRTPVAACGGTQFQQAFALGSAEQLGSLFETAGFADVALRTVTRPVRFPDPGRYLTMAVSGAIVANPDLQQLPDAERSHVLASAQTAMKTKLHRFMVGDHVVSTKQTHIVRALC